jgi:hypothetical protein
MREVGVLHFVLWTGLFFLSQAKLSGQDYIIRIYGDTIHCKIDQQDERFIYYRTPDTKAGAQELISLKEVRYVEYGVEPASEVKRIKNLNPAHIQRFQFSFMGGASYLFTVDEIYGDDFEDFYNDQRWGWLFEGSANYFFNESTGAGLMFSRSRFSTSEIPIGITGLNPPLTGLLSSSRQVTYIGGNLAFKVIDSKIDGIIVQLNAGIGLLHFEEDLRLIESYRLEDQGVGGHLQAMFQLSLGQGFYLSTAFSVRGFNLFGFEVSSQPNPNPELDEFVREFYENPSTKISLNRLEGTAGLTFCF